MLGREKKSFIIRLIKITKKPLYHIVVTRKKSKANSRSDCVGKFSPQLGITLLQLDINKLIKYLAFSQVTISLPVYKLLNLDTSIIKSFKKSVKNVRKS